MILFDDAKGGGLKGGGSDGRVNNVFFMRWKRTIVTVHGSAEWLAYWYVRSVRMFVFHENTRNHSKVNRSPDRVPDETR